MRKIMKKTLYLLIGLLIFNFAILNTKAADLTDGTKVTISGSDICGTSGCGIYYAHANNLANRSYAYMTQYHVDGVNGDAWCVDPDALVPNEVEYSVETITDSSSYHDIVASKILTSNVSYTVKSYALRALNLGLYGSTLINTNFQSMPAYSGGQFTCAFYNTVKGWVEGNSEINSLISKHHISFRRSGACTYNTTLISVDDGGAAILSQAKELLFSAMKEADTAKAGGDKKDVKVQMTLKSSTTEVNDNSKKNGTKTIVETVPITLDVKNLDKKDGKIYKVKVDCPTCAASGVTTKLVLKLDSGEFARAGGYYTIEENTNLALFVPEAGDYREGKLNLSLTLIKDTSYGCDQDVPYQIKYTYTTTEESAYVVAVLKPEQSQSSQNFYAVKLNETITGESNKKITEIDKAETGKFSCTISEDKDTCLTSIESPDCYGKTGQVGTIKTDDDIKYCILNNTDEAGNSYKLTNSVDNKYCAVYCKEDYASIDLQKVVGQTIEDLVGCGRDFTIKAAISGTKMCFTGSTVTGKSEGENYQINVDLFNADMERIQKDMLEQYRLYSEAVEALNNIVAKDCGGSECVGESCTVCTAEGTETKTFSYTYYAGLGKNIRTVTGSTTIGVPPKCGACSYVPCEPCDDNGCATCCSGGYCIDGVKAAELQAIYTAQRDNAERRLGELALEYTDTIKSYNSCTTGWTNVDNFLEKTKVKYYYNEHLEDDTFYSPYYELLEINGMEDNTYLEKNGNAKIKYLVQAWKGAVAKDYSTTPDYTFTTKDNPNPDKYGYSASYSSVFDLDYFSFCTTSGCIADERDISKAMFINKQISSAQDYQVPTSFYQVGNYAKIIAAEADSPYVVEADPLEHSLPVSNKACSGGEFDLYVEGLGEFYDDATKSVGRLLDSPTMKIGSNKSVGLYQKNEEINPSFDGDYVCNYNTDCDCGSKITDCDPSYAGQYISVEDYCIEGHTAIVDIKCCDIYYKETTVSDKIDGSHLNTFYCEKTKEYYQTKEEATSACSTDHISYDSMYRCPDGTVQSTPDCKSSVSNTYTYEVPCNFAGGGGYAIIPVTHYSAGHWVDINGNYCDSPYAEVLACDAVSYYNGVYVNTLEDAQWVCSQYAQYCLRKYSGGYKYGAGVETGHTNNSCPSGYYYDTSVETVENTNCGVYTGSCTGTASCEATYTGTCIATGTKVNSCPDGYRDTGSDCVKSYTVTEITEDTKGAASITREKEKVVGDCYDYYGNTYPYEKLVKVGTKIETKDYSYKGDYYLKENPGICPGLTLKIEDVIKIEYCQLECDENGDFDLFCYDKYGKRYKHKDLIKKIDFDTSDWDPTFAGKYYYYPGNACISDPSQVKEVEIEACRYELDVNCDIVYVCKDKDGNKYKYEELSKTDYTSGELCRMDDKECNKLSIRCCTAQECKGNDGQTYDKNVLTDDCDCEDPGCPNCKLVCNPECELVPICEGPNCCPSCEFKCFNCIFNNGLFTLNSKAISPTTLNESTTKRNYGYNWVTNNQIGSLPDPIKDKMELFGDKAEEAITEITERGELIYDSGESSSSTLEFSVVMNDQVINELKKYNDEHDSVGGYANESLKCYDDYDESGNVRYKKIYCYSEVIDQLLTNHSDVVTIGGTGERKMGDEDRKNNSASSGYWTLWDQVEKYKDKEYNSKALGGPAWK